MSSVQQNKSVTFGYSAKNTKNGKTQIQKSRGRDDSLFPPHKNNQRPALQKTLKTTTDEEISLWSPPTRPLNLTVTLTTLFASVL